MLACLTFALIAGPACSTDSVTGPSESAAATTAVFGTEGVTDLGVVGTTQSSVTLSWTEVDDGTGAPATYRLKYGPPPIDWTAAEIGCDPSMEGTEIGAERSCTVEGLAPDAEYQFQLMSYRMANGAWEGALYSNVATASTQTRARNQVARSGIWVDRDSLMQRPTTGPDWDRLLRDAERDPGSADIADQDSNHDVYTLAAAIVCVRTGEYCDKARQGVLDAIGTEDGARWLAVGRNLGSYVIAADLLDLRSGSGGPDGARVEQWIEGWLSKDLRDNNTTSMRPIGPFHSGANAAAQEGFVHVAVAAYLGDQTALQRAWDAYRTFVCDPGAPDTEGIYLDPPVRDGWTHDDQDPCAVNPRGTSKRVPSGVPGAGGTYRIDGALAADMRRGGTYRWEPGYTSYPWVGLEGLVPAAVILERAGYPAFEAGDRAVLRTHEYLWFLRTETGEGRWFDGARARDIVHLVNRAYDADFPIAETIGAGRTVGYTGWTHP